MDELVGPFAKAAAAALTSVMLASAPPIWFCIACPLILGMAAPWVFNLGLTAAAEALCKALVLSEDECMDLWCAPMCFLCVGQVGWGGGTAGEEARVGKGPWRPGEEDDAVKPICLRACGAGAASATPAVSAISAVVPYPGGACGRLVSPPLHAAQVDVVFARAHAVPGERDSHSVHLQAAAVREGLTGVPSRPPGRVQPRHALARV